MRHVLLMLPFPPTVNHHISTNGRQRYILPKGRQFRAEVCEIVRREKLETMTGRLEVFVELFPDSNRRMDIMNREKPLCDALTHAGVWLDDSQIDDFRIVRRQVQPKAGACKVIIYERGGAMTTFYLVERTEASAIGLRDRITREVITDELQTGDVILETCEAASWREAKALLVAELTPAQKDFADALRLGL